MSQLAQSYSNFRFLVRGVRWVELALSALIVFFTRAVSHLEFPILPVLIVLGANNDAHPAVATMVLATISHFTKDTVASSGPRVANASPS